MSRGSGGWGQWVAFAGGTLACVAIAVGAYLLAQYSWAQVADYKTPYVTPEATLELSSVLPTAGPAIAQTVVLVIVDGLREDVSRSAMPTLNTLRGYGSDMVLTVPQPSLSYPNWTTILTGASQSISGVTTNGYTGREPAPTLIDVARAAKRRVVVVGPTDFTQLFGVQPGPGVTLRPWPKGGFLSGKLVDDVLRLSKESTPGLVVLHLPDVDEAGHEFGGASSQYKTVAGKVDMELARLVAGLQSASTTFVVVADHGHVAAGGHGGWEPEAITVPGVFAGAGVRLGPGTGNLTQVAPTVSALLGVPVPAYAESTALTSALATRAPSVFANGIAQHNAFARHYVGVVSGIAPNAEQLVASGGADVAMQRARTNRLDAERQERWPYALMVIAAVATVLLIVGFASWRALVAAFAGSAVYFLVYNVLFFVVHRYRWSLSAFNTETYIKVFMNWRLGEAALAALAGVAVAALVYPLLRRSPKGPQDRRYLAGYLALAPATLLVVLCVLALQVGWYLWYSGATVTWTMPDLMWAFKYDLDLVQMTAVGAAALVAPLVTYLVGRYHPKVAR